MCVPRVGTYVLSMRHVQEVCVHLIRAYSTGNSHLGYVCEWHILLTFITLKFFQCAFFINVCVCLSA